MNTLVVAKEGISAINKTKLSLNHEIVQKLFRPFIRADFFPDVDSKGKPLPAKIDKTQHDWLYKHALMFGLDPEKDLNIPKPQHDIVDTPIDTRMAADLARYEAKRLAKDERQRARKQKQLMRMLQDGKITEEDLEEEEEEQRPLLPMRLLSRSDRAEYESEKLQFINTQMSNMDKTVAEWRKKRRESLLKVKETKL